MDNMTIDLTVQGLTIDVLSRRRFFWIIVWVLFTAYCVYASLNLWNTYYYHSVAYEMETNFLSWNTTEAPTISICFLLAESMWVFFKRSKIDVICWFIG